MKTLHRQCMRTCWSNFPLRLSSSQSCLVRNTLLIFFSFRRGSQSLFSHNPLKAAWSETVSSLLDSAVVAGQTLDIDHLDSLDPELYRNLLALKTYEGDVQVSVERNVFTFTLDRHRINWALTSQWWWRSLVRPELSC